MRAVEREVYPRLAGGPIVASGYSPRRRLCLAAAVLVLVAACGGLAANPAHATLTHELLGSFGSESGSFINVQGVAVDQSGSVYVLDTGSGGGSVFKFDAEGKPAKFSGLPGEPTAIEGVGGAGGAENELAVDNSAGPTKGDIYIAVGESTGGEVAIYGADGKPLGALTQEAPNPWGEPCGVAVDPSGAVYVGLASGHVNKYAPSGNPPLNTDYVSSLSGLTGETCNVAADSSGNAFVDTWSSGPVTGYAAAQFGAPAATGSVVDEAGSSLAVDPSTDDVYVDEGNRVAQYGAHGEPFGEPTLFFAAAGQGAVTGSHGIAVSGASGDVYVSDGQGHVNIYGPAVTAPDVITGSADNPTPTSATAHGTVNPDGVTITDCHFDYGTTTSYGQTAPCVESVGSGTSPVPVHADLTGLSAGVSYHYRLSAANSQAAAQGQDQVFTLGPEVGGERATQVSSLDATLNGVVKPNGSSTHYHFEWTSDADFKATGFAGAASLPIPDGSVGANEGDVPVSQQIKGLQPFTTYRFRLVASNPVATAAGPGATFTTYPSTPSFAPCANDALRVGATGQLPDCRAYEQATPVDKHGSDTTGTVIFDQAAASGGRVTFADAAGLPTAGGSSHVPVFTAVRGASAWTTPGMMPATDPGFAVAQLGWDENLTGALSDVPKDSGEDLVLTDIATGAQQDFAPLGPGGQRTALAGFSADGEHFIFESLKALVPGAVAGAQNLYAFDDGTVTLAGRVPVFPASACDDAAHAPDCVPAPAGSFAGPYDWDSSVPSLERGGAINDGSTLSYYTQNTISADGSKVFFTEKGTGRLYVREDARTVQISASQASSPDPNGPKPAAFLAATPSGSMVFFASCEKLTDDSTAISTAEDGCVDSSQGQDLYSYDTSSGRLTDLSVDPNGDPQGAAVQGVLGVSQDGSDVYFAANGDLDGAGPATLGNCTIGGEGACNVYLSHAGSITFVARLAGGAENWQAFLQTSRQENKKSRVAADGTLLLTSAQPLTAYDNTEAAPANCAAQGCLELYRYRPGDSILTCVSCDPTGARPNGDAFLQSKRDVLDAGSFVAPFLTRNISADGSRVFFDTGASLLASDTNGVHCGRLSQGAPTCSDVYEWEANGAGSCESSDVNGGCLYLLSTGRSGSPSFFADASASGGDAFFFTRDPLVPQDTDSLVDVYDARVGGGLASQHAANQSPSCADDECQGSPSTTPADERPGSSSLIGPGNLTPAPAVAAPRLRIVRGSGRGSSLTLTVSVPSKGRITVTGTGLSRLSRAISKPGTYNLTVKLTAKQRKKLERRGKLTLKPRILYVPAAGVSSRTTTTVKVKV